MNSDSPLLSICLRCRDGREDDCDGVRGGTRLAEAVVAQLSNAAEPPFRLRGINCMSQCKRPCTIALSAPDRYTYLFGDLDPTQNAADVLTVAAAYTAAEDGFMPRLERPHVLQAGILGRIPPLGFAGEMLPSHPPFKSEK